MQCPLAFGLDYCQMVGYVGEQILWAPKPLSTAATPVVLEMGRQCHKYEIVSYQYLINSSLVHYYSIISHYRISQNDLFYVRNQ